MSTTYEGCRQDMSNASCNFAVVCTYTSATLGCILELPQIYKNWRSKSLEGLSVLWATALFTASVVNSFFVFHTPIPVYFRVCAVVVSVESMFLLIQFWAYSKESAPMKFYYSGGCFILWIAVITLELALNVREAADKIQWIAIVLWILQLLPQIITNIRLRTTIGQSTATVVLTLVQKTFEFLAHYILSLPEEYKYMTYFSITLAYINGMQVIWYPKPQQKKSRVPYITYGSSNDHDEEPLEADEYNESPLEADEYNEGLAPADPQSSIEVDYYSEEEMASMCAVFRPQHIDGKQRFKELRKYQIYLLIFQGLMLVVFAVGLCANLHSSVALFAPITVAGVLLAVFVYRGHRENRLGCMDPVFSWCDNCCNDQPVSATW